MSEEKAGRWGETQITSESAVGEIGRQGCKINSGVRNRWIVSEGGVYAREEGVSY